MIITIITSPFCPIPPHAIGAVEKLWFEVSEIFWEEGHEVRFISKRPNNEVMNDDKVTFIKGYARTGSLVKDIFLDIIYSIHALLKIRKTDILVVNTLFAPLILPLFRWKFKRSVYNVARFPKKQFSMYCFVDRLSCVSEAVKIALIKQTPSAEKRGAVKVISNFINTKAFTYRDEIISDKIKIYYSGRVHPEKGLDLLAKAYSILKKEYSNIKLYIVGARDIARQGGGEEYINELTAIASDIEWIDPIYNPNELCAEISKCNIYCYPSVAELGETFGVAPLEAMACGRATIVSALDCFKDFVHDGENALVFDHRAANAVELLTGKIKMLIESPNLRSRLGVAGAKTAKEDFSTEKIANLYLHDFEELLKK